MKIELSNKEKKKMLKFSSFLVDNKISIELALLTLSIIETNKKDEDWGTE